MCLCLVGIISSSRKLLQCNYRNNRNCNRRFDSTSAQLAANNRAIVNTQYAIRDAVESGANPYVTQGAANYGNVSCLRRLVSIVVLYAQAAGTSSYALLFPNVYRL